MSLWVFPYLEKPAAENMSLDSMMLEIGQESDVSFRSYGWSEPSYTFGYPQKLSEVTANTSGAAKAIIRRPTGGGIVCHFNDWTYALAMGSQVLVAKQKPIEIVGWVHQLLANALIHMGIGAQCFDPPQSFEYPKACFEYPSPFDVVRTNDLSKIAGVALKRTKRGLIMQGSLDRSMLPEIDYNKLGDTFAGLIAQELNLIIQQKDQTLLEIDPFLKLVDQFRSKHWNHKR
jgi:lipoate-protein ligase A